MRDSFYGVTEQGKASKHRLDDSRNLMNAERWRGAMYLAGYSVECLLKTKLMLKFGCRHLRELDKELHEQGRLGIAESVFTHQLEVLIRLTGAMDRLRSQRDTWKTFSLVNRWTTDWRYSPDLSNLKDAGDFMDAVQEFSLWIENNT